MRMTEAKKTLDGVMNFHHTPEGMVRGGEWVKLADVLDALESHSAASKMSGTKTPRSDNLEALRIQMRQERTPAYGDALALCRKLEAELSAAHPTGTTRPVAKFDEMLGRPVLLEGAPMLEHGQLLFLQTTPVAFEQSEPDAWLFKCARPGKRVVFATVDKEDTAHWPLDQWRTVERFPLRSSPEEGETLTPAPASTAKTTAPSCSLGCTKECVAQMHGCTSECPALPARPPFISAPPETNPSPIDIVNAFEAARAGSDKPVGILRGVRAVLRLMPDLKPAPDAAVGAQAADAQSPATSSSTAPAFWGFLDQANCRVELCFSPSTPRSDGTYATAYYTRPPLCPPFDEIGSLLANAMNEAAANGANSVSMPDDYVVIANWLSEASASEEAAAPVTQVMHAQVAALRAYEAAFEDLFGQCASNPIRNAWGKQVDTTKLNYAHLLASSVLKKKG